MAVELSGDTNNQYVNCGSAAMLDNVAQMTIAAFVRIDTYGEGNAGRVADKDGGDGGPGYGFQVLNTGETNRQNTIGLFLRWVNAGNRFFWTPGSNKISTGAWYHVAVSYDRGSISNDPVFYVDGVRQTTIEEITGTGASGLNDAGSSLFIGRTSAGVERDFDGQVADFRFFTRLLSDEEVAALAAGYPGPLGGEAVWLSMLDGAGITHWDGATLAGSNLLLDLSGNGNDGTPTNSPVARASKAQRAPIRV
jgi:hypothetical protein